MDTKPFRSGVSRNATHRWLLILGIFELFLSCGMSGCALPVGPESPVVSSGVLPKVDPLNIAPDTIHTGMSRDVVHQNLKGIPCEEITSTNDAPLVESYGPIRTYQSTFYFLAYHGPHSFGLHRAYNRYDLKVVYDKTNHVTGFRMYGPWMDNSFYEATGSVEH